MSDDAPPRQTDVVHTAHRQRRHLFAVIATFITIAIVLDIAAIVLLSQGEHETWRLLQGPLHLASILADGLILFLAWLLFNAIGRIDRESARMQAFMDNVYRRLP